MSNVPDVDPNYLMGEIERCLAPGGRFDYEGPHEITALTGYLREDSKEQIHKAKAAWTKQSFTKLVRPDAATADDADPRFGVNQYDVLPSDAALALDATGYYYSDATSSGLGNRLYGYPSQGALLNKATSIARRLLRLKKRRGETEIPHVENLGTDNTGAVSKGWKIVPILKADKYKQVVYCVVLSPEETDLQDDFMTADEIEKAAHEYLIDSRIVGSSHSRPIDGVPVESYIAPQDFEIIGQLGPQLVKKGAWVIALYVRDPKEWQKVLDGEYTGVSVGGWGQRTAV
jgi:hypothetical protein